jgi:hypothetical protein
MGHDGRVVTVGSTARAALFLCAALVGVLVSPLSSSVAGAWSTTITVDQRHDFTLLEDVVVEASRTCETSERVTVRARTRSGDFASTFDCSRLGNDPVATMTDQLLRAAGRHNNAAQQAKLRVALYRELLPNVAINPEGMAWGAAVGSNCQRGRNPKQVAEYMAAGEALGEAPEHWTLVEAVDIAASCPKNLPVLFRNVARAGEPEAATAAKRRLQRAASYPGGD